MHGLHHQRPWVGSGHDVHLATTQTQQPLRAIEKQLQGTVGIEDDLRAVGQPRACALAHSRLVITGKTLDLRAPAPPAKRCSTHHQNQPAQYRAPARGALQGVPGQRGRQAAQA
ncbi:hypothetical protein D3C75_1075710 [compost metagenome]